MNVVYCRGRASETIGRKLDQGSAPAILLREAVEKAIENGRACSSRIIEISNALFEQGEAIAIPILTLEKDSDTGDEMSISDLTVGVFGSLPVWEDGFGEELSENAAMGLRLLRGDAEEMAVSVSVGGKIASVHIRDLKIRRKVEISGGAPLMNIEIAGSYEIMSAPPELKSAEISDAAEKQLLALCADAYRETAATGRDFVMLGRMLYRSEPEYIQKAGIFGAIRGAGYSVFARLQKY